MNTHYLHFPHIPSKSYTIGQEINNLVTTLGEDALTRLGCTRDELIHLLQDPNTPLSFLQSLGHILS